MPPTGAGKEEGVAVVDDVGAVAAEVVLDGGGLKAKGL